MTDFNRRLDRLEWKYTAEGSTLGPTAAERKLAEKIRANPRLRRAVAYDDPTELTADVLAGLTAEDHAVLERYFEGEAL